jgi:hypothetical protein
MTKRSDRAPKSQTHFEQIPLVVVKKVVGGDITKVESAVLGDGRAQQISRKRPQQTAPAPSGRRKER